MIERNAGTGLNEASECHMLFPVRKMVFLCELPSTVPSFWTLPMVPKYSTLPTLVWLGSGLPIGREDELAVVINRLIRGSRRTNTDRSLR